MKDHMMSIGNVPAQLLDNRKGDIKNRAACAGETMANNAVNGVKSYGIVAGTALAVDTFAGNKKVVSFLAEKFPKVAEFGKKIGKKIADVAMDFSIKTNIGPKLCETGARLVKKFPGIAEVGKKAISFLKANKKTAIIAAGATALFGAFLKWGHSQGRIDQKYEDKAKLDAHRKDHEINL